MFYNANLYKVGLMNSQPLQRFRGLDRSGISGGGGCSLIVTSSSFVSDRLGSAAIEQLKEYPWFTAAFTADYVLGISIYIHATVRSFGPLLDTSAIRAKNMKHSDYNRGTSPPREMPDLSIRPCPGNTHALIGKFCNYVLNRTSFRKWIYGDWYPYIYCLHDLHLNCATLIPSPKRSSVKKPQETTRNH